jgi:hypothetical protein
MTISEEKEAQMSVQKILPVHILRKFLTNCENRDITGARKLVRDTGIEAKRPR